MSLEETTCEQAEMSRLRASMLQDLRERLLDLRMFSSIEEINRHAEDQDSLIILTAESTIKSVVQMQDEFLAKISEYRSKLIGRTASAFSTNSACSTSVEMSTFQVKLRELTKEIERFKSQHLHSTMGSLQEARSKTDELRESLRQLKREMKRDAFGGEFMTFQVNNLIHFERGYFGSFVTTIKHPDEGYKKPRAKTTPTTLINEEPVRTFESPYASAYATLCHSDGFILTSFSNGSIRAWNKEFEELKKISKGLDGGPLCHVVEFLELSNKFFLTGHENGLITMWNRNLTPRSVFIGHTDAILFLMLIKSGNFASLSDDHTLKIWNQQLGKRCEPRMSFKVQTTRRVLSKIGVLSNGFLITIADQRDIDYLQIWDVDRGLLVESFMVPLNFTLVSFIVLPNDDVVISTICGHHYIFNLVGKFFVKVIKYPRLDAYRLFDLPNGFIIAASLDESSYIQVWDAEFNQLVQDFPTGHTEGVVCCSVSPDGKTLVTGSYDATLKVWTLTID